MTLGFLFERLSGQSTTTEARARRGKKKKERERERSYFMCTHVMNEYVFHVNCAHEAYCNGPGLDFAFLRSCKHAHM